MSRRYPKKRTYKKRAPYKKTYRKKKTYNRKEYFQKLMGMETKLKAFNVGPIDIMRLTSATATGLNNFSVFGAGINKGEDKDERIGTKIDLKRLEFRGLINGGFDMQGGTTSVACPHCVRIALIYVEADHEAYDPKYVDFLQYVSGPAAIASGYKRVYDSDYKYKVIKEKKIWFPAYTYAGVINTSKSANADYAGGAKEFKISCKPRKKSVCQYSFTGSEPTKGFFCVVWGYECVGDISMSDPPMLIWGGFSTFYTD